MNQCSLGDQNFEHLMFAIRGKKCIMMPGPDAPVEEIIDEFYRKQQRSVNSICG